MKKQKKIKETHWENFFGDMLRTLFQPYTSNNDPYMPK